MGKMKLTKKNKRNKPSSGIPNWLLTTIISIVILAVLFTCVFSLVTSNGVVLRVGTAMKSDDYKVNGNMMKYYFTNTYNSFLEQYETYLSSFSLKEAVPISDLDDIVVGGTAEAPNTFDTMLLGDFTGTWYDYFISTTKNNVSNMLVYCEKADDMGIALTDEELQEIDTSIDSAILQFKYQQALSGGSSDFSDSACLAAMYGNGIKKSDVRKAMQLSTLASKCQEQLYNNIEAGVTEDRINTTYEENKSTYDKVDYVYYSFSVLYDDSVDSVAGDVDEATIESKKADIEKDYKEKIEKAKAAATELSGKTTLEEFKDYLYNYVAAEDYDDIYAEKKPEDAAKLPSEEVISLVKEKIIANVIAEAKSGATEATDDVKSTTEGEETVYTVYEQTVTKEFSDTVKAVKTSLFASVKAVDNSYTVEKESYNEENEFSKWAFSTDRVAGERNVIESGDTANGAEFSTETESFDSTVYFLAKTRYKDESATKNVAYMMFTDETTAKAAAEMLVSKGEMTQAIFDEVATSSNAALNTIYENYQEGLMQSSTFDNWLYDEKTVVGTYTTTPLTIQSGSYMVAYYVSDGDTEWVTDVKNTLISEDYTAEETKMIETYSPNIAMSEWVIGLIKED